MNSENIQEIISYAFQNGLISLKGNSNQTQISSEEIKIPNHPEGITFSFEKEDDSDDHFKLSILSNTEEQEVLFTENLTTESIARNIMLYTALNDYENLHCYDNEGESADQYTIIDESRLVRKDLYEAYAASSRPFHPMGIGMHVESALGDHLGKKVSFNELPNDVKLAVTVNYMPTPELITKENLFDFIDVDHFEYLAETENYDQIEGLFVLDGQITMPFIDIHPAKNEDGTYSVEIYTQDPMIGMSMAIEQEQINIARKEIEMESGMQP